MSRNKGLKMQLRNQKGESEEVALPKKIQKAQKKNQTTQ